MIEIVQGPVIPASILKPEEANVPARKALDLVALSVRYVCRYCRTEYAELPEALLCARKGFKPSFQVGDLVTMYPRYAWFDNEADWLLPDAPFGGPVKVINSEQNAFRFLYVVTYVDGDPCARMEVTAAGVREAYRARHRPRHHLKTLALGGPNFHTRGWAGGFTFDLGHYAPIPLPDPYPYLWALDRITELGLWGPCEGLI